MSDEPKGKLTEQINFGVTEETFRAAEKIERDTGVRVTHLARSGFIKELQLYRHPTPLAPVTAQEAKAIESFKKVTGGGDIVAVLSAASREHVLRAASLGTSAMPAMPSSTGTARVIVRARKTA